MDYNTPNSYVPADQQAEVCRSLIAWLSNYDDKPCARLDFEHLNERKGLALSVIQGAYKTKRYIDGTYEAQLQFKIIYRDIPDGESARLDMDEVLNEYGSWAEIATPPILGDNINFKRLRRDTAAAMFARYENGAEDHQILMTLTYEVI